MNDQKLAGELRWADVILMLLWGGIGGTLPTLARIAGTFGANFDAPMPNWTGVSMAVAAYAFIGGVIARAFGKVEVKQALFAGIAAPAILTNVIMGVTENRTKFSELSFMSTATAQQTEQSQAVPGISKMIIVQPFVPSGEAINGSVTASVKLSDGQIQRIKNAVTDWRTETKLLVPNNAESVSFADGDWIPLPSMDATVQLKVTPKSTVRSDFLWALGAPRTFGVDQVKATLANSPKGTKE